jgi:hypothetical protein
MAWYHNATRNEVREMDPAFLAALVAAGNPKAEGWTLIDDPEPGQYWNGSAWESPPAYVPPVISDRQFFHALAKMNIISEQEALAAVATGTIPQAMSDIVEAMPVDSERFDAKMYMSGAVEIRRDHALVSVFGGAMGWTGAQIDDLFTFAANL